LWERDNIQHHSSLDQALQTGPDTTFRLSLRSPLIPCSALDTIQLIVRLLILPSTFFLHRLYLNSTFRRIFLAIITLCSMLDTIQLINRLLIPLSMCATLLIRRSTLDTIQLTFRLLTTFPIRQPLINCTRRLLFRTLSSCSKMDTIPFSQLLVKPEYFRLRSLHIFENHRFHLTLTGCGKLDTIQASLRLLPSTATALVTIRHHP